MEPNCSDLKGFKWTINPAWEKANGRIHYWINSRSYEPISNPTINNLYREHIENQTKPEIEFIDEFTMIPTAIKEAVERVKKVREPKPL